jgi:acyl-CoA reductase-like NAD-dependent aldehyde dehydrogenase
VEAIADEFKSSRMHYQNWVGDPMDPATQLGPLSSEESRAFGRSGQSVS